MNVLERFPLAESREERHELSRELVSLGLGLSPTRSWYPAGTGASGTR